MLNTVLLKFIFLIILIFNTILYALVPNTMDKGVMLIVVVLSFFSVLLFLLKRESTENFKKTYFKHSSLFLLGFLIVSYQYPLDYLLGYEQDNNLFIWVNRGIVLQSLVLSSIGLTSFMLGYLFFTKKVITGLPNQANKEKPQSVGLLICLSILFFVIYLFSVNQLYLIGYYGAENMGANASRAILMFKICVFAAIVQKCRNQTITKISVQTFKQYLKFIGWPLIAVVGVYLLTVILSGDRGPLITFTILFFAGFIYLTKFKIKFKSIVILIFIGSSIITLLGAVRNLDRDLSFAKRIEYSWTNEGTSLNKSILPPTKELGGSINTIHAAVNQIENNGNYFYGRFQFQQLAISIPFSYLLVNSLFDDADLKFLNSASYITWLIQGSNPTYGNGTSSIADLYLDFGLLGVFLGMLGFGYLIRFLEVCFFSRSKIGVFALICSFVYLSEAIYISRSSVLYSIQSIVWIYIILWLNKHVFTKIFMLKK